MCPIDLNMVCCCFFFSSFFSTFFFIGNNYLRTVCIFYEAVKRRTTQKRRKKTCFYMISLLVWCREKQQAIILDSTKEHATHCCIEETGRKKETERVWQRTNTKWNESKTQFKPFEFMRKKKDLSSGIFTGNTVRQAHTILTT